MPTPPQTDYYGACARLTYDGVRIPSHLVRLNFHPRRLSGAALLQVNPADRCVLSVKKDGSFYDQNSAQSQYKFKFGDAFQRIVVRRDAAGVLEVFVNGASVWVTGAWAGGERAKCGNEVYVFYDSDSDYRYGGVVRRTAIHARLLSDAEIAALGGC